MKAGHPCYFVGFLPEPDARPDHRGHRRAPRRVFLETVIARHPEAEGKPCVIGNCQAGWAVMMLAALRPELFGPIIIAGSPLSYWAGVRGQNPMRYSGGLLGGSLADRADRRPRRRHLRRRLAGAELREPEPGQHALDQAVQSLVQDRHRGRALPRLREVVGRPRHAERRGDAVHRRRALRRQQARRRRDPHRRTAPRVDLRNIRSPIVVFCSKGDNITPPQQALDWILDLYDSVDDIRAHGQTIVYTVHEQRRPSRHLRLGRRGAEGARRVRLQHRPDRRAAARPLRGGADAEGRGRRQPRPRHRRLGDALRGAHARRHPRARRQRPRRRAPLRRRGPRLGDQPRALPHLRPARGPRHGHAADGRGDAPDAPAAPAPTRCSAPRNPCLAWVDAAAERVRADRRPAAPTTRSSPLQAAAVAADRRRARGLSAQASSGCPRRPSTRSTARRRCRRRSASTPTRDQPPRKAPRSELHAALVERRIARARAPR